MNHKKVLLVLITLVFLLLIIILVYLLFFPKNTFFKNKIIKPKLISETNIIQSSLKQEYKTYFVDLIISQKNSLITKVNAGLENISHPLSILSEKPILDNGYLIFQTKLLSNDNNLLYTTWNKIPKYFSAGKKDEFKFTVLVPYTPQTILQLYSSDGNVFFTERIK